MQGSCPLFAQALTAVVRSAGSRYLDETMYQVLFRIPLKTQWTPEGVPIYGFGLMLFVAFVVCTWLAGRRAQQEGIAKERVQDLGIWIFVGGIVGARIVFMIQYDRPLAEFFKIWEGGLVFYGSAIGGVVGYLLAYVFVIRRHNLSSWQLADIVAPTVAMGLCLGRIGCFLNGCCYGNVAACEHCPSTQFYLCSPAYYPLVKEGFQTAAGFTLADEPGRSDLTVDKVVPHSPAEEAGLEPGDVIEKVNGRQVATSHDLDDVLFGREWKRGETVLNLTVRRLGNPVEISYVPRTLGLHPTQLYESISMGLLFLLLTAFYPFRQRYGEVFILFMVGYSIHRFLNEMLRNDTAPLADGLTLSENGSILFFLAAVVLWIWLRRHPERYRPAEPKLALEKAAAG
jgi:phosphatidylglycerol:prolipoprotein diacylglycerol transferase